MTEFWHRIDLVRYAAPLDEFERPSGPSTIQLIHQQYPVVKTTAKGVRLDLGLGYLRLVLKDSKRQFASPTFEQAKEKFRKRKERQLKILREQMDGIKTALAQLEKFNE